MPQYFLKGWAEAYPGQGRMNFNIPPDAVDVEWNISLHDETKAERIAFSTGFAGAAPEGQEQGFANNTAFVEWENLDNENINFDYEITPVYASSPDPVVGSVDQPAGGSSA